MIQKFSVIGNSKDFLHVNFSRVKLTNSILALESSIHEVYTVKERGPKESEENKLKLRIDAGS